MKIWVDDLRPAPEGYIHCYTVIQVKNFIQSIEGRNAYHGVHTPEWEIELIDLDHDAGDFINQGGDYIKILDWLEATGRNYPIRIHSMNSVGVANMRRIIQRNGWKEV